MKRQINIYWNLAALLSWIMNRDLELAQECNTTESGAILLGIGRALMEGEDDLPQQRLTFGEAHAAALTSLTRGQLTCYGKKTKFAALTKIQSTEWIDKKFYFEPDIAAAKPLVHGEQDVFYELRFPVEEIVRLWEGDNTDEILKAVTIEHPDLHRRYETPNSFIQIGDHWEISFDGVTKTFNNTMGLRYIRYLIQHQDKQVHVRDLYYAINSPDSLMVDSTHSAMTSEQLEEQGLTIRDLGDAGDVMTPEGKTRVEMEVRRLQEQIDEAAERGDTERQAELEDQQRAILEHLANETGLSGRSRKSSSSVERIRKAVTNRIKDDIKKVAKHHNTLARHLDTQIHTGTQCRYAPEPPIEWIFSAD